MKTYQATIKLGVHKAGLQRIYIDADNESKARQLLEMQYGRGNFHDVCEAPRNRGGC